MKPINSSRPMRVRYPRMLAGRTVLFVWLALSGLAVLYGCKKEDAVAPTPPVITVASTVLSGTVNTRTTLEASATGGQGTLAYAWAIKSAPTGSTATVMNANTPKAELTPDKSGTYGIGLTVTDVGGLTSTAELTLTASLPGKPPVISVVTSMTAETGQQTSIDASKSSDPDGDKLTYAWTIKTKPTSSTTALTNAQGAIAGFTADVVGSYILSLSITDGIWPAVSQDVSVTATAPAVKVINGSWTTADGTSGGSDYTPRNKFYSFKVATDNQPVSLTLTSADVNVGLILYDALGTRIGGQGITRSQVLDRTVNAGTYSVMVYTTQRYEVGAFRLAGRGLASEFTQLPNARLQAASVSFGTEGGGGGFANRPPVSPRNQYYTFDVTEDNSVVDINVAPAGVSIWMTLRSPTGADAEYTLGTLAPGAPRYFITNPRLNKGTYGLYVGTGTRDAVGTATVEVAGMVKNLKQTVYDQVIQTDSYVGKNATVTYTLTITEDNSVLDLSLRSPDIIGSAALFNPSGSQVDKFTVPTNYDYILKGVNKGVYKITVTPGSNTSGIGKYTLSVYGKFSDLKKQ